MRILLPLALAVLLIGCKKTSDTVSTLSTPVDSTVDILTITNRDGLGTFTFTKSLGTQVKDIYFILTNPTSGAITDPAALGQQAPSIRESFAVEHKIGLSGTDQATRFNNAPILKVTQPQPLAQVMPPQQALAVGATNSFKNTNSLDLIPATLRSVTTDGGISLNIWVADAAWGTCSLPACMDQTMVDSVAAKFLQVGADNDIYDWVTNIYGVPWGPQTRYPGLIPASAATEINILYFDISNDSSQTGGILGFFWAKDNYLASSDTSVAHSNERLLFYMDSVLMATKDSTTWALTDTWPSQMISTLAHEFQHMIHFYQKTVLLAPLYTSTEVWLNEMCSQITEDLLADKIQINGPRGIAYNDPTAGSATPNQSRFFLYNQYNDIALNEWRTGLDSLRNYSMSYAFGAYLTRNFGGATLMRNIVQSSKTGITAITQAVAAGGFTQADQSAHSIESLLIGFGIAGLLSDRATAPVGYQYNTGSYFTSTLGGITYNLGSVNLFLYGTPKINDLAQFNANLFLPAYSNSYTQVASGATGDFSIKVAIPAGSTLSVLAK